MKKYAPARTIILLGLLLATQLSCSSRVNNSTASSTVPVVAPDTEPAVIDASTSIKEEFAELREGNLLYFQGSFNMEWTWYLNEIIEDTKSTSFVFSTLREDLTNMHPLEELIKPYILQIKNNALWEENKILLRAPFKEGEHWTSEWKTRIGGYKGTAEVTIIKVTEDSVLTEAVIKNVLSFRCGFYKERNLFKKGYGLVAFACNTDYAENANFDFQMTVQKFAENPPAGSSWVTPWYIRPDKNNLKTWTDYSSLLTPLAGAPDPVQP